MKLVIAKPSPFARKVRVALREKGLAFEEIVENPWAAGTAVPGTNPLGKVPALILEDGRVVYDSKVIVEYLETLGRPPPLIPADPDLRIAHKQIEAMTAQTRELMELAQKVTTEITVKDWRHGDSKASDKVA